MNSPLQLKEYVFSKTLVEANMIDSQDVSKAISVDTDIKLGEGDETGEWALILTVKTKDSEDAEKPSAYKAEVSVIGKFDVDTSFPKDKTPRMVAVTGASLLYGVVREMIANITARSVHGIYTLPTTSFVDLDPKKVD